MVAVDFEDFIEEVKFQMTEYDNLTEEIILDWEEHVREWLEHYNGKNKHLIKKGEDVTVMLKDESTEPMEEMARKYYHVIKNQTQDDYWSNFKLVK